MKEIVAWPICWILYWCGDAASRVIRFSPDVCEPGRFWDALMDVYQWTMNRSYRLQIWAEGGSRYSRILPWRAPDESTEGGENG